ncbi:MAG: dihydroorotase family protein [Candidatus Odinarchaeota archaeon]
MSERIMKGHILVNEETGVIDKISMSKIPGNEQQKLDLKGKLVIPGLVDIHVHLRDFEESHKETYQNGGQAAAAGGFTTVFDMPNKKNLPVNSYSRLKGILEKTKNINEVEIIPYLLLTKDTPRYLLAEYSYTKAYLGQSTGGYLTGYADIADFLKISPGFLSVHCEDNDRIEENKKKFENVLLNHSTIRDPESELICIKKLIRKANKIKSKAILHTAHLTLPESVSIVKAAGTSFEVTPHHLLLNDDDFLRLGARGKMNPPLRSKNKQNELFEMFLAGDIPVIATDHAPHTLKEKEEEEPSGVPGLETCLPLFLHYCRPLNNEKLKLIIDALAVNPRRLMNLPGKGIISEKEPADLTVVDLEKSKKVRAEDLYTKCKWSPWEGTELEGWPVMTIRKGRIVWSAE